MPVERFRGDPYVVLGVRRDASSTVLKRRWRELAREHHPDRAAGDGDEAARLTTRMARINAAYDLLRDPARRSRYDSSPDGRRASAARGSSGAGAADFDAENGFAPSGPPPPPRTSPVTARFDTSASYRPRNTRLSEPPPVMRGHPPRSRRESGGPDLRASTPTGPVERRPGRQPGPMPTLRQAREATLEFGRYNGYTLGEVELIEPAYVDWVARTITRDRDLVVKARVIQAELDRQGTARQTKPAEPGFENRAAAG